MELCDEILRMNGFHVQSTVYSAKAIDEVLRMDYNLVLIDVESDVTVKSARDLCDTIKKADPGQHVATKWVYLRFVKNYRPLHFVCSS
jgi:DNA-binding response OmpR family regulator